jgi:16S rRNA (cytidine1402-2'-O)-methyltransferase
MALMGIFMQSKRGWAAGAAGTSTGAAVGAADDAVAVVSMTGGAGGSARTSVVGSTGAADGASASSGVSTGVPLFREKRFLISRNMAQVWRGAPPGALPHRSVLTRILFTTVEPFLQRMAENDGTLPPLAPGTLYLVATPIGNLEDITLRALRTLKGCDVVAAEDTRRTGQLLSYFGISRPILSYFRFNEARRSEEILERLRRGETVALVTDAGSPGISDPGERVVRAARAAGLRVEAVPGPCALVAALTASGLPADEFHFIGFLPIKSGQRRRRLEALRTVAGTLIVYESPWRIEKLLAELAELLPAAIVVLARELTKKFEEYLRGSPAELLARVRQRPLKGEMVVLVHRGSSETGLAPAGSGPVAGHGAEA